MATEKQSYHHGEVPAALKAEALRLIEEGGIAAFTIRRATRAIGLSHAAPYRHFRSKEALLSELAAEGFGMLAEAFGEALAETDGDPPLQRFVALGRALVIFAREHRGYYSAMFDPGSPPRENHEKLAEADDKAFNLMLEVIKEGQASGDLIDGDPAHLVMVAWTFVHGYIQLLLTSDRNSGRLDTFFPDRFADLATNTLLNGFIRRP